MKSNRKRYSFGIPAKLALSFGLAVGTTLVLFIYGSSSVRFSYELLGNVLTQQVQPLATVTQLQSQAGKIRRMEIDLSRLDDLFAVTAAAEELFQERELFLTNLNQFVDGALPVYSENVQLLMKNWQLYDQALLMTLQVSQTLDTAEAERRSNYDSRPRFLTFATQFEKVSEAVKQVALLDYAESRKQLNTRRYVFIWVSVLGAGLSIVFAIILARSISIRIRKLQSAATAVARGHTEIEIPVHGDDELADLAAAFKIMQVQVQRRETSLQKARDELEERVKMRTVELEQSNVQLKLEIDERQKAEDERRTLQEKLIRSQKMEALGLLAGGVAHDLNNVLSGILTYPDFLLVDLPADNPMRHPLCRIKESGIKASAIVQDLLTLARRGVATMKVENLNEIIRDYLDSPEHQKLIVAHESSMDIKTRLAENLLCISGSRVHLYKTLMNLVTNAVEAEPRQGRISIETYNRYVDLPIRGYEDVSEGDYVVMKVQDWGSGITEYDLDRVFEPFFTKKELGHSGTGLGMAVVWATVQDHKGYIDVESDLGQGTTFELYFPATREAQDAACQNVLIQGYMGEGEHILVVDDVETQREIASQLLHRIGYRVDIVESGEAAIDFLQNRSVDLVILDMIMDPGIDGLDTYRSIIAIRPGQKTLITSGFAETDRVRDAIELGAGPYIRKPYTIETLGLAIRTTLAAAPSKT